MDTEVADNETWIYDKLAIQQSQQICKVCSQRLHVGKQETIKDGMTRLKNSWTRQGYVNGKGHHKSKTFIYGRYHECSHNTHEEF